MKQIKAAEVPLYRSRYMAEQMGICPICELPLSGVVALDHCFTERTELLTKEGWSSIKDVEDMEVMQQDGDILTFVKPSRYINQEFEGNLIELKKRGYYSLTTDEHLIPVNGTLTKAKDIKLTRKSVFSKIGSFEGEGVDMTFDELRFMVALQADSYIDKSGWARFRLRKKRKITRLKDLLKALSINYSEHKTDATQIYISKKELPNYATKILSNVFRFSKVQLEVMYEEVGHWDGSQYNKCIQYSSKDRENIEFFNIMATLLGKTTTTWLNKRGIYMSNLYKVNNKQTAREIKKSEVPHEGRVYCVTVPSGILITRTKGIVSASGNCHTTGILRGTLHSSCNSAEGRTKEGARRMQKGTHITHKDYLTYLNNLIAYLQKHTDNPRKVIHHSFDLTTGKQKTKKRRPRKKKGIL